MSYAPPAAYDATNVVGRRIAAALIDLIPAFVIGLFIVGHSLTRVDNVASNFCAVYRVAHSSSSICIQPSGNNTTAYYGSDFRAPALLFSLVYWFAIAGVLQGATGATFGKHMVGLRVVDAQGNVCGMGKAILRTVVGYFELGFCFLIGCITALATHPHRRIGDFAAGTYVVAKESVGRPLGTPPSSAYPPAWAPPGGPVGWGPPPAGGQPGLGGQAQPQQWGAPTPGGAPPASSAPATWGTPAASPPPAQVPTTWGAPPPAEAQPAPAPAPAPVEPVVSTPPVTEPPPATEPEPTPAAATDAAGWAAPAESTVVTPAPAPEPQPEPQPEAAAPPASAREPQWDAQRNAWVFWEAETNRWLQHDPATGTWGPLR